MSARRCVLAGASLALFGGAALGCGSLPEEQLPDAGADSAPPGTTTYQGKLATSPTVNFGGNGGAGMNFCNYTIALSQIEVTLDISTTGEIKGGSALALATEMRLASTTPACTAGPGIPANIHRYTYTSSSPVSGGNGYTVKMAGDPGNEPEAELVLTVVPSAGAFSAAAKWTRLNAYPILTWVVSSNLTLTVKP